MADQPQTPARTQEGAPSQQPTSTPGQSLLPRTNIVRKLIAEAHKYQIGPKIISPTTFEEHAYNVRMLQLDNKRKMEDGPGACVCTVKDPSLVTAPWFIPGHECGNHARQWFHIFHCTRALREDYAVLHQDLKWCQCQACVYFVTLFKDGIAGSSADA